MGRVQVSLSLFPANQVKSRLAGIFMPIMTTFYTMILCGLQAQIVEQWSQKWS
jgi:hypothetical protein